VKKYRVTFGKQVWSAVEVEAEDEEAAIEKATEEFVYPSLCAQCSGWGQDWYVEDGDEWLIPDKVEDAVEEVV
jgi:hypothetical protein